MGNDKALTVRAPADVAAPMEVYTTVEELLARHKALRDFQERALDPKEDKDWIQGKNYTNAQGLGKLAQAFRIDFEIIDEGIREVLVGVRCEHCGKDATRTEYEPWAKVRASDPAGRHSEAAASVGPDDKFAKRQNYTSNAGSGFAQTRAFNRAVRRLLAMGPTSEEMSSGEATIVDGAASFAEVACLVLHRALPAAKKDKADLLRRFGISLSRPLLKSQADALAAALADIEQAAAADVTEAEFVDDKPAIDSGNAVAFQTRIDLLPEDIKAETMKTLGVNNVSEILASNQDWAEKLIAFAEETAAKFGPGDPFAGLGPRG